MAIYNLSLHYDIKKAVARIKYLARHKKAVEIKEIKPTITKKLRGYLHVILTAYALEYGETIEYVKQRIFKRQLSSDIFIYQRVNPKDNSTRKVLKSSEEIPTDKLVIAIERFKDYSAKEMGFVLPDPDEKTYVLEILKAERENKRWL